MNPLTNVRNITKLNEREISLGVSDGSSWHTEYKDSAWIFIGGLDFQLTEGDILCVFSQYGEIVNVNLVRDKKTGKSKGYCFLCFEDQRSTNLAVDNLNGIKISGRTIRVDHVANYRIPKEDKNADLETKLLRDVGCAPEVQRDIVSIIERGTISVLHVYLIPPSIQDLGKGDEKRIYNKMALEFISEETRNVVREEVPDDAMKVEVLDCKSAATSSTSSKRRVERQKKHADDESKRKKENHSKRDDSRNNQTRSRNRDSSSSFSEALSADERHRDQRRSNHADVSHPSRKRNRSEKKC